MDPFRLAAIAGFLAVALGAFGAHGLKTLLLRNDTLPIWQTAVLYHLVHAVVLLVLAVRPKAPGAAVGPAYWLILAGMIVFSGSLYTLAVTNLRILGTITPLGGVALLAGWLWLMVKG